MISYLQVVSPLPVMWSVTKMLIPVCECPFFKKVGDVTLLSVFFPIMKHIVTLLIRLKNLFSVKLCSFHGPFKAASISTLCTSIYIRDVCLTLQSGAGIINRTINISWFVWLIHSGFGLKFCIFLCLFTQVLVKSPIIVQFSNVNFNFQNLVKANKNGHQVDQ